MRFEAFAARFYRSPGFSLAVAVVAALGLALLACALYRAASLRSSSAELSARLSNGTLVAIGVLAAAALLLGLQLPYTRHTVLHDVNSSSSEHHTHASGSLKGRSDADSAHVNAGTAAKTLSASGSAYTRSRAPSPGSITAQHAATQATG